MTLVVDASVAIKWFVNESDSLGAEQLLMSPLSLYAPNLLRVEFAGALWNNLARKTIAFEQARQALARLPRSINVWRATEPLLGEALQFAVELEHPIYDLIYLALAREIGSQVVTADSRFMKKVAGTAYAADVIHLADWRPR